MTTIKCSATCDGPASRAGNSVSKTTWSRSCGKDNVRPDGTVQKHAEGLLRVGQEYPVVLGQAGRRAYTLLTAYCSYKDPFGSGGSVQHVHADEMLQGTAWFTRRGDVEADRLVVHLRHLTGWVDFPALSVKDDDFDDSGRRTFAVITATSLPNLTTNFDGGSVDLVQSLETSGDHIHSLGVTQGSTLRIAYPEVRPVSSLLDTSSDFQDLLSIAVDKAADFERVTFQHPSLLATSMAGTPFGDQRANVEYFARWIPRSDPCPPVDKHQMFFTLADLGGIEGVRRWLHAAANYRTELGRVMATRYNASMYLEDRIMNICAALDSFDTVRRGTDPRLDFIEHLDQCIALAGQPFLDLIVGDPTTWAMAAKETRHDLAHHRERFRRQGSLGEHLVAEQLFWLFAMCMLRLSDAPEAVFDSIARHGQTHWLIQEAIRAQP